MKPSGALCFFKLLGVSSSCCRIFHRLPPSRQFSNTAPRSLVGRYSSTQPCGNCPRQSSCKLLNSLNVNPILAFPFYFWFLDRVSLCNSPSYPGTSLVGQAGLERTEICLPLPPESWDGRCVLPLPGHLSFLYALCSASFTACGPVLAMSCLLWFIQFQSCQGVPL